MHGHLPHPATPLPDADFIMKRVKKRGSYTCGRCGKPKKGHKCPLPSESDVISTPQLSSSSSVTRNSVSAPPPPKPIEISPVPTKRRRALSFDDADVITDLEEYTEEYLDTDLEEGKFPGNVLWEILRRLPPSGVMSAARVCKLWRETTKKIWRGAEELRLRVPVKAQIGFVGSVLHKCCGLVKLSLIIESDVDATVLACIAFSCPNLQSLEIFTSDSSVNRISGDELSRFIAEKKCLTSLKIEGCSNLGGFVFSSTSLSTLWLSDLHSLSKMVFNCPNLKEISLDFSRQENDSTDLANVVDGMGRTCPKLQNIHIASIRLSHTVVLALSAANLRGLRMLSLVLGSEITDASVAAISSSFSKLELLDLSGSGISDSGIGMICNVFPQTLTKLLLALCPNITSSGIQFAAAQLPRLELMDCGMTLCDPDSDDTDDEDENECELDKTPNSKLHLIYQKLIIKHHRLKKLSLWGCSGLDALYLNCPHLSDLNLNSCKNLHPERLVLQCPNLECVHASDCQDTLIKTVRTQVCNDFSDHLLSKRLPDGSKRIQVPLFCSPHPSESEKRRRPVKRQCTVISTS